MRAPLVICINFVVGAALFAWVLREYGAPAIEILGAHPSVLGLAVFLGAALATLLSLAWRWHFLISGLCQPISLVAIALYRSAAHSLAVLVPSGKVGGDPLRVWLAVRAQVNTGQAVASVAVDRTLEIGSTAPFSLIFAALLLEQGIPGLERVFSAIAIGTAGLGVGIWIAVRRLRRGAGLVTTLARLTRLSRVSFVDAQMDTMVASEEAAASLIAQSPRMLAAFAAGLVTNLLVIAEFFFLLTAFGLPADPIAVVAAIFATGAAHMFPVPAGIGVLEGGQIWLFGMLGYPADVGLAVGLAVRLRELIWMFPGILYLAGRSLRSSLARLHSV